MSNNEQILPNRPFKVDPQINNTLFPPNLELHPPKPRLRDQPPLKLKPAINHLFWAWTLEPNSWHLLQICSNNQTYTKLAVWTGQMFMSHVTGPVNGNTIVKIRKSF